MKTGGGGETAKTSKRARLEQALSSELGRELSARTILFHQAIADIAGISVTDLKCLDYLSRKDDVTAGDLARLTGLTTGTITAAIDRLEHAGLAHRQRSASDRRKVFIVPSSNTRMDRLLPLYQALTDRMSRLVQTYTTPELATIEGFLHGCIDILKQSAEDAAATARAARKPR